MSARRHSRRTAGGAPEAAAVFAALGDGTRLRLVARLSSGGPMSIARLTTDAAVTRQAITKHLHVLAEAGLARSSRLGRESVWQLEPQPIDHAREYLDGIAAQWDQALDRLKKFVEG
jgi:DNA-binding transcriptional ArsR family regulator